MKKLLKILCVSIVVLYLTGCGAKEEKRETSDSNVTVNMVTDDWKKDTVKKVAEELNELANDEKYIQAMGYDYLEETIEKVKNAKIDSEKEIQVYDYKEGVITKMLGSSGLSMDEFSEAAKRKVKQTEQAGIVNMMTSKFGVSAISTYSVLQTQATYAVDKAPDKQIWIIPTDSSDVFIIANIISNDELYPLCTISCGYLVGGENALEVIESSMDLCRMKPTGLKW